MLDKSIWDKEIPVPQIVISYVDDGIFQKLPEGTKIVGISPSGASYWARTAKIEAAAGDEDDYFVKVHQGERSKSMVAAEYQAIKELYKVIPEMVSKPEAWGSYESIPDTHFFATEFHEMSKNIPNKADFPALVAELHKRGVSPDVSDTWEECFTKGMQGVFAAEMVTHGPDEEMEHLENMIVEKVIPRLLRPLETGGRSIYSEAGHPMIFDATPLYAHNEYELGPWRSPRHKITVEYIDEYIKHFKVSDPAEEFDDRGALYSLRFDMHSSSLYPGNLWFRGIAKETMHKLLEKYGEGFEGYAKKKGIST